MSRRPDGSRSPRRTRPPGNRDHLTRREALGWALATGAGALLSPKTLASPAETLPLERRPIALFSKPLQWLDYDVLAETVAEATFDALDLTVRPGGHVEPPRVEADLPRAVAAAGKAGLTVPMITTAITSAEDSHAESVLRTAAGLGVGHYRMGYVRYDEVQGVRRTLDALVPRFRRLAELGERLGIRASYQNHAGTAVGAAVWDLYLVLERTASPWIGAQYDVRHDVVEGASSWVRDLEVIAPFIHTLVAKDFVWVHREEGWRVENVPLGEGMVPLDDYVRHLRRLGVTAPFTVHFEYPLPGETLSPAERRRQTVAVLRRDLDRLRSVLADPA